MRVIIIIIICAFSELAGKAKINNIRRLAGGEMRRRTAEIVRGPRGATVPEKLPDSALS